MPLAVKSILISVFICLEGPFFQPLSGRKSCVAWWPGTSVRNTRAPHNDSSSGRSSRAGSRKTSIEQCPHKKHESWRPRLKLAGRPEGRRFNLTRMNFSQTLRRFGGHKLKLGGYLRKATKQKNQIHHQKRDQLSWLGRSRRREEGWLCGRRVPRSGGCRHPGRVRYLTPAATAPIKRVSKAPYTAS
jgi:hypothetical protein